MLKDNTIINDVNLKKKSKNKVLFITFLLWLMFLESYQKNLS